MGDSQFPERIAEAELITPGSVTYFRPPYFVELFNGWCVSSKYYAVFRESQVFWVSLGAISGHLLFDHMGIVNSAEGARTGFFVKASSPRMVKQGQIMPSQVYGDQEFQAEVFSYFHIPVYPEAVFGARECFVGHHLVSFAVPCRIGTEWF